MMGGCEDMILRNNNENKTENIMYNLYKSVGKFPDITSPDMMEERGNKEHDSINKDKTDAKINKINEE